MIQMKYLISSILFCSTLTLSAIDINNTTEIIEEATKATEELQKDFSNLIDMKEPTQQEPILTITEHNITAKEAVAVEDNTKNIKIEENITIENSIVIEEQNETIQESKEVVTVDTNETRVKSLSIPSKPKEQIEEVSETSIDDNSSITDSNTSQIENNISTPIETEENQTIEQESITEEEEEGSSKKGMMIFKTKLKKICKMTGDEFAKNYTQEDWDDIYDNDEFEKVVYELCPAIKGKYNKKWTNDLYQFSLQYASDSDEIPEC